jgi:hypothetical protein
MRARRSTRRARRVRRHVGPVVTVVVAMVGLACLPRSEAGFVSTTNNAANAWSAAASFSTGLTYQSTGPITTRTSSGSLTVAYPTGTQPNDLLLLVEVNAANQNITTPPGWTLAADAAGTSPQQFRFTVWWKLAAPAESSVTLPVNTNASGANAAIVRYANPAGYPPNPVSATAATSSGAGPVAVTRKPTPDVTTNVAGATVISLVAVRAANPLSLSVAQSFTARTTVVQSATGQPIAFAVAERSGLPLPSTPVSPTWTQGGTAAQWAWATLAFS